MHTLFGFAGNDSHIYYLTAAVHVSKAMNIITCGAGNYYLMDQRVCGFQAVVPPFHVAGFLCLGQDNMKYEVVEKHHRLIKVQEEVVSDSLSG